MNAIKTKLQSNKGASITFALLLFLVCAVISSIVIVAATAVGGRASKMAESDQRYYAVNSAAELLRDVLEDQTVTVTTGTKTVSTVDQDDVIVNLGTTEPLTTTIMLDDMDVSTETDSLVVAAARNLVGLTTDIKEMSLTASGTGIADATALNTTIVPRLAGENLCIMVSNANVAKGVYTLELTFKADIVTNENTDTKYGTPEPTLVNGKVVAGKYTREKNIEEKKVSTIRWRLINLQTIVANAPAATTAPVGG